MPYQAAGKWSHMSSQEIFTPHSQKSLQAFLEAAISFQCRTRAARIHEGLPGRGESDARDFKRIQKEERVHNVAAAELKAAAEEYIKSDNSLKFPYICVREYQKNGNVHYHIIIFGIPWLKSQKIISQWWEEYGQVARLILMQLSLILNEGIFGNLGQFLKIRREGNPWNV